MQKILKYNHKWSKNFTKAVLQVLKENGYSNIKVDGNWGSWQESILRKILTTPDRVAKFNKLVNARANNAPVEAFGDRLGLVAKTPAGQKQELMARRKALREFYPAQAEQFTNSGWGPWLLSMYGAAITGTGSTPQEMHNDVIMPFIHQHNRDRQALLNRLGYTVPVNGSWGPWLQRVWDAARTQTDGDAETYTALPHLSVYPSDQSSWELMPDADDSDMWFKDADKVNDAITQNVPPAPMIKMPNLRSQALEYARNNNSAYGLTGDYTYDDGAYEKLNAELFPEQVGASAQPAPKLLSNKKKVAYTAPAITGNSYLIKAGDTLSKIAKRAGLSVKDIARFNGIEDVNKIYAGQKLKLGDARSALLGKQLRAQMKQQNQFEPEISPDSPVDDLVLTGALAASPQDNYVPQELLDLY